MDGESAWHEFLKYDLEELIRRQVRGVKLNGIRLLDQGIQLLLGYVLDNASRDKGINVFISHDAIIAPLIGYMLGKSDPDDIIPGYLEGILLYQEREKIRFFWRKQ